MNKNWLKIATGMAVISALTACGSSSDSPSAPPAPSANSVAFKAVTAAIDSGGGLIANTVGAAALQQKINDISTFVYTSNQVWNAKKVLPDPRCSGGSDMTAVDYCSETPKPGVKPTVEFSVGEYVGFLSDPDAVRANGSSISVFGRVKSALGVPCLISLAIGEEIPTSSTTKTVTFTAELAAQSKAVCNMDIDDKVGMSIDVVFAPTANKDHYDTKISFTKGDENNQDNIVTYARITDKVVRVAVLENNTEGTRVGAYRTMVNLDRVTGVMSAEYLSFSKDGANDGAGSFHRLYVDKSKNEGVMMSATLVQGAASTYGNSHMYVLVGKPGDATSKTAFTFVSSGGPGLESVDNDNGYGDDSQLFSFTGCAKQSDAAFDNADITTCGGTDNGVAMVTKLKGLIDAITLAKVTSDESTVTATAGPKFTKVSDVIDTAISLY